MAWPSNVERGEILHKLSVVLGDKDVVVHDAALGSLVRLAAYGK